jgi:tRNA(Arg) A34 adenosine deaminase TadA
MCKSCEEFMLEAIGLSIKNIDNDGGPFGAVIVKDGKIIARGVNRVTSNNDPTAHAEVNAIREAAAYLGTFDLKGCEIYSSCEPCPMCLGAIYWARLDKLYFANTKLDAKNIDFDDSFIYEELDLPIEKRKIPTKQMLREKALEAFNKWKNKTDKIEY